MKTSVVSILLMGFAIAATASAPKSATKIAKLSATPMALICPVTHDKISSIKEAAGSSTYKGKKYYFCCGGCKPMFDANPAKYIKPASKS